jgi:hypothetical protein
MKSIVAKTINGLLKPIYLIPRAIHYSPEDVENLIMEASGSDS